MNYSKSEPSLGNIRNSPRNNASILSHNGLGQNPVPKNFQVQHPFGRVDQQRSVARDNRYVPKGQYDVHRRDLDLTTKQLGQGDFHLHKKAEGIQSRTPNLFQEKQNPAHRHIQRDYDYKENFSSILSNNQHVSKNIFDRNPDININNKYKPAHTHIFRDIKQDKFKGGGWNI